MARSCGWDESMNGSYPSARLALALREGDGLGAARAVHDCSVYPFVLPVLLGGVQLVTGISEHACRVFGRLLWCAGLFGLFLLGREVVRVSGERRRGAELVPWLALALGALSPLALDYSGSLLLELPSAVVAIFALRAWLRRGPAQTLRSELAAGAWLTVAFFTKFNFGLLLGFGLFLDLLVETALESRAGRARAFSRRTLVLAAVPSVALAWWFLLPLPFGAEMARAHRAGFASFLGFGTDSSAYVPWRMRALHWTCFLAVTPRVFLLQAAAMGATLRSLRSRPVRTLWIVFLASGLPVWTHNYHIDRYLLPGGPLIWCLAAYGLAPLLPTAARPRALVLGGLALLVLAFPAWDSWQVVRWLGIANAELQDYQRAVLAAQRSLSPARDVSTNGLARADYVEYLDLLEPEIGESTRVGWIGASNVFSPAALFVGLVERGAGSRAALRDGRLHESFVTTGYVDPGWSDERIQEWARAFDLVLSTDPIDLTVPDKRGFLVRYRTALVDSGEWSCERLGSISVRRPLREPFPVQVLGCRPKRAARSWTRFRGPNGSGTCETGPLPTRLGPENLVWRTPLPPGRSSPVLSAERVFVTALAGGSLETLCLDRESGAIVWRAEVPRERAAPHHEHNSPAAPSPAVGEHRVVAFFADFGLVAYDHEGGERWRKPLGPFETNADYGLAASPIIEDGKVILALDEHRHSLVLALREEDGAELWRVARPAVGGSWSTPVIHAPPAGPMELIHTVGLVLESLELETGRRLRWARGTFHEPISGATVAGGVAYLVGFGPPDEQVIDGALVRGQDGDGDGRIALAELPAWKLAPRRTAALFALADRDADGGLDGNESEHLRAIHRHYMMIGSGTRNLLAVRLAGSGDVTEGSYAWAARGQGAPEISLPVVYRGSVYCVCDSGGVVTQLDRDTGAVLERRRIDALQDMCFASPVAADDKLFLVSHGGTLVALDAGTLDVLGVSELGEACYATPALADGRIYVRTESALYCFGSAR